MEFQEIYTIYGPQVYRFLLSLTADETWAEELTAETFYQAFLHMDQFQGRCSLYSWLCQIGKNAWIKEAKRRRRFSEKAVEEHEMIQEEASVENAIIKEEELMRIRRAMQRLKAPYIDVFTMHIFAELKLKEIALLFGKSESWARVTYYRAKEQILEIIKEEEA